MRIVLVSQNKKLQDAVATLDHDLYQLSYFETLPKAALNLASGTPVLIIDSAVSPQMLGELRQDLDGELPYLIYVSHQLDREPMSELYSLGVDELFPLQAIETLLPKKLATYMRMHKRLQQIAIDYEFAHKTAMDAMSGNSELGQVINFVEQSYGIGDCKRLADRFFTTSNSLGLNCVLLMEVGKERYFFSSSDAVKPLEEQLLLAARGEQRFHDFGPRTVINYPNASLLIKNMPLEDLNRYGRLKDALPVLLGSLDAKLKSLMAENLIRSQTTELGSAFDVIKASFMHLNSLVSDKIKTGNQTMSNVLQDLSFRLPGMGLDEDQEEYILEKVETVMDDSADLVMAEQEMAGIFEAIRANLHSLVEKQNHMLDILMKEKRQHQESEAVDATATQGVELF